MRRAALLACGAGVLACQGTSGTLDVSLTTAPGSTVLDAAQTLRLTVTNPHSVTEVARGSDGGFDLAFGFDAIDEAGSLVIEALDGSGATLAVGESPPFPLSAINAKVVIYMAAPRSFGAAPLALDAARTGVAVVPLVYGGILAGGRDGGGATTDELHVYNAYDHSFASGAMLPATRSAMAAGVGVTGEVYFFGGFDELGSATGSLWKFDPTQAPVGMFTDLGTQPLLARAGQAMLDDGLESFVISGMPALQLAGGSDVSARADLADAPPQGASVVGTDGAQTVVFCGASLGSAGCTRVRASAVDSLALPAAARTDHAMLALPAGQIALVGGALAGAPTRDVLIIDATAGTATTTSGALSTARLNPAIAYTPRYIVVAGGSDGSGSVAQTADLLDATTFALIATVPMVAARAGAAALALPNEQVLVVGGVDGSGAPSDLMELFTPDAPP